MGIVDNRVWQIRWTHVSQPILEHGRGYYFGIWQWCHYGWCRPDPYFFMKILTTFFTYRCLPSDDLFSCRLVTPPTFRPRLSGVLSKFSHNFLKFYLGVTSLQAVTRSCQTPQWRHWLFFFVFVWLCIQTNTKKNSQWRHWLFFFVFVWLCICLFVSNFTYEGRSESLATSI